MLHVDKVDSLQAENVHITASGLEKAKLYKFRLEMYHSFGTHASYCIIQSDTKGNVDLAVAKPIRGTYIEADPMGLFLSLQPTENVQFARKIKDDTEKPSYYALKLFDGSGSNQQLDQVILRKHWRHPLVSRIEIRQDGLIGTLFKPPGPGPFPCILDIPGANGAMMERPAAMMASEGFVVFVFAYFLFDSSLPPRVRDVDVEYFAKPLNFIQTLPYCSGKIGLQGLSFGGTLSTYIAIKYPGISAVVSLNGSEAFLRDGMVIKENGELIPSDTLNNELSVWINNTHVGVPSYQEFYRNLTPEKRIPWEKARKETAYRIVAAMDDLSMCAVETALNIHRLIKSSGGNIELDLVPGGHLFSPPYTPHDAVLYNRFAKCYMALGGEIFTHSKSQETIWRKNVDFFKRHLGCPPMVLDWKREERVVMVLDSKL